MDRALYLEVSKRVVIVIPHSQVCRGRCRGRNGTSMGRTPGKNRFPQQTPVVLHWGLQLLVPMERLPYEGGSNQIDDPVVISALACRSSTGTDGMDK